MLTVIYISCWFLVYLKELNPMAIWEFYQFKIVQYELKIVCTNIN